MDARSAPVRANGIFQVLSSKTLALLDPHMRKVKLPQGTVLHEAGDTISYVYFPISGMVSMLAVLKSGEAIEAGIIGPEGFVGGYQGVRGWRPFGHAVMQMSGEALRINVRHFKKAYDASDELRILINGYQAVVHFQAQQTAACQALHTVEARMCRWLLRVRDLTGSDEMELTQEFLAQMLGVRRTSVSLVANTLQQAGFIKYRRGLIQIVDVEGVRSGACECYDKVRANYERLLVS